MQTCYMRLLPNELISLIYGLLHISKDVIRFSFTAAYIHAAMPIETRRILNILKLYRNVHSNINNIKYLESWCRRCQYSIRLIENKPVVYMLCPDSDSKALCLNIYYYDRSLRLVLRQVSRGRVNRSIYFDICSGILRYIDDDEITCELVTIIKNISVAIYPNCTILC